MQQYSLHFPWNDFQFFSSANRGFATPTVAYTHAQDAICSTSNHTYTSHHLTFSAVCNYLNCLLHVCPLTHKLTSAMCSCGSISQLIFAVAICKPSVSFCSCTPVVFFNLVPSHPRCPSPCRPRPGNAARLTWRWIMMRTADPVYHDRGHSVSVWRDTLKSCWQVCMSAPLHTHIFIYFGLVVQRLAC